MRFCLTHRKFSAFNSIIWYENWYWNPLCHFLTNWTHRFDKARVTRVTCSQYNVCTFFLWCHFKCMASLSFCIFNVLFFLLLRMQVCCSFPFVYYFRSFETIFHWTLHDSIMEIYYHCLFHCMVFSPHSLSLSFTLTSLFIHRNSVLNQIVVCYFTDRFSVYSVHWFLYLSSMVLFIRRSDFSSWAHSGYFISAY